MKNLTKTILLIIILIAGSIIAQTGKGSISGKITDKNGTDVLIGANVQVVGKPLGASSDIDGHYRIKNLEPGKYDIKVSYISYKSTTVSSILVEAGKDTKINIELEQSSTEIDEVVVMADALHNNENAILKIQKNSIGIMDGLSAELISKNNSSDGTDVLKAMPGITISEGKFAYIRGIGDRYNNTLLNGASLPSTDPEKKSFSYDIFPASLIENLITAKTFTPDKPGDFTGGLVQIQTLEFPQKFFFDLNVSSGFNRENNLTAFKSYNGGSKDFLGLDDGTRAMPSLINGSKVTRGTFSDEQLQQIGRSFNNNWNTREIKSPLNYGLKFSLGDRYYFDENTLGIVASLSYSNSYDIKNLQKSYSVFEGPRYNYQGSNNVNSVIWGSLLNVSYKFAGTNKISFKNTYNQAADDEVTIYRGAHNAYGQYRELTELKFISRSLYSSQLLGEHQFNLFGNLKFDWNLNYSQSKREEPDARRYMYSRDLQEPDEPLRFQLDQSLSTRFYGKLNDNNIGGNLNFTYKPYEDNSRLAFKFGITVDRKERDFTARLFGFKNIPGGDFMKEDAILQGSVDEIFRSENINPKFIEVTEITKPSDSYTSGQNIIGTYLMVDFDLLKNLKLISGLRFEKSKQTLNAATLTGDEVRKEPASDDFLPSFNLNYVLSEDINLRFAFSRTLARPEFRELAPYAYYDFQAAELVQGNENLTNSRISNLDFRFEAFPNPGELIAISLFYKYFNKPIEQVLISASGIEPIRSYQNADNAYNYGLEIELRKDLNFISSILNDFNIVTNLSFIRSRIELDPVNNNGFQVSERPLQGQANYIINTGLYYDNYDIGLSGSLTYNRVGERIAKVGFAGLGDIIELSRDQIDFSISKKLINSLQIKFTVKDILAQDHKFLQRTDYAGDITSELENRTSSYSLGVSVQF